MANVEDSAASGAVTNNNVGTNELSCLPMRVIDFDDLGEKTMHDKMVKLVDHMLDLNRKLAAAKIPGDKTRIQRQIDATDKQIDKLVYKLYGLSDEEIAIVEDSTKR